MIAVRPTVCKMIRASFLFLVCLSIATADSIYDSAEPTCEILSPTDVNFNFSKTGLTTVKKNFMVSDAVTCMYLTQNNISELDMGAFDGLPNLRYLNLAGNPIAFGDFANMNLSSLRSLVFDGPSDHDEITSKETNSTLDENDVRLNYHNHGNQPKKRLFTDFPMKLPNLQKVSFNSYRDPTVLKRLNYMDVPNLTHLSIAGNGIREIRLPQRVTDGLTHLNADNNEIDTYSLVLPKLRYLSINGNHIQKLCMMNCNWNAVSVGAIPTLEHLSVAYNELRLIENDTFDNSTELKSLNFTGNELTTLPQNLTNIAKLRSLALSQNNLTEFPNILGLVELEILELAENSIVAIDRTMFSNLTKLRVIDLHGNLLMSVADGTFADLPALTNLDLSQNQLTTLPANWIGSAEKLVSLELDGNSFRDVANMSLGIFKKLAKLSIGNNPFKVVMVRTLALLPPDTQIKVHGFT